MSPEGPRSFIYVWYGRGDQGPGSITISLPPLYPAMPEISNQIIFQRDSRSISTDLPQALILGLHLDKPIAS